MKCQECNRNFPEEMIHESHDIPCYLFFGQNRKERKKYADRYGREWLCKECHDEYENYLLNNFLDFLGEETPFHPNEKVMWMKEISRLNNKIKKQLREIALKIKSEKEENERTNKH